MNIWLKVLCVVGTIAVLMWIGYMMGFHYTWPISR